jgi:cathepsin B
MRAAFLASVVTLSKAAHPVRREIVNAVNADPGAGWVAEDVEHNIFANHSVDEIKGLMGLAGVVRQSKQSPTVAIADIPELFDARSEWPHCVQSVRDQAHCGSCWAFAAAETLTDNLCVLGVSTSVLSAQDLISCDSSDHACKGGTLLSAWSYIDSRGLVEDSSFPYQSGDGSCNNTCVPACSRVGTAHKCPVAHTMLNSDAEIQGAVMTTGAVEVGFFVMEDFMNYKSGIYEYHSGMQLGGHAVKVIGWGSELSKFYWVVQNSWGPSWGENGFFRIRNWHDDKESAFAIGGGEACVQGSMPSPPSPAPAPEQCTDIVSYCSREAGTHAKCEEKSYLIPVCKKTCGCCEHEPYLRPSYCSVDGSMVV